MSLNAPNTIKVSTLRARHPTYDATYQDNLWRLYVGGKLFDPARFIIPRRGEPNDLYEERLKRAFYLGYVGEIVDFFVANLFYAEPSFALTDRKNLPDWWDKFDAKSNRGDLDLNSFLRTRWTRGLAQGRLLTWVDLPELEKPVFDKLGPNPNLAELDDVGARNAYLVGLEAEELSDWKSDAAGNFTWATIEQSNIERAGPFSTDRERVYRWTVLDRDEMAVYTATEELQFQKGVWAPAKKEQIDSLDATLVTAGPHPFGTVPLVAMDLPEALQVGPKLKGVQTGITEIDCAVSFQMYMALYAMPVIKSEKPFQQRIGESNFVQLERDDGFEWTEPHGHAIAVSMTRRDRLVEEMFRISHQMAQAVKSSNQTAGRSGESKKRDTTPTLTVLEALGAEARDYHVSVLEMVARGRQEPELDGEFEVSGYDEFDVHDEEKFVGIYLKANAANIHSETFQRKREMDFVDRTFPDLPPDERDAIRKEIEDADLVDESGAPFMLGAIGPPVKGDSVAAAPAPGSANPPEPGKGNGANPPKPKPKPGAPAARG